MSIMLKRSFTLEKIKWQLTRSVSTNVLAVKPVKERLKSWHEIPGPSSLPFIGPLLHFLPGGSLYQRSIDMQDILYEKYGPVVRLEGFVGLPPITFIFDPEAAWNIFRKEEPLPSRPGFESWYYYKDRYFKMNPDDYGSLIADQGESWKQIRTVVNPVMLQPKTIKLYNKIMNEVAEDMVKRMKFIRNEDNTLKGNFNTEMNLWSLESVGVVGLGGRLNCFDPNLPEDSPVKKLINTVHEVLLSVEKLDTQPSLWKYFSTPDFKKGMKNYAEQNQLNDFFIEQAIEQIKAKGETPDEEKGVLEKLLEIDRRIAVTMASDMLFAGVDTTAATVIGLLYLLATNLEKQTKLREEVANTERRPYMKACIKESLRMYPVVGGNFRKTTKEHNVLGYNIPKDTCIIVGNQHLCKSEEHFPKPNQFVPERWIVDKSDPLYYGNAHPFVYTPFGFGVRSCIGRRLAELEVETFVAKVVENFQIGWFGPPPRRARTATINCFLPPYNFTFKDI